MANDFHDPHSSSYSDQDDFWHGEADWTPVTGEVPHVETAAGGSGSPLEAVRHGWNSLLGGNAPGRRSHGTPTDGIPRPSTEVAAGAWSMHATSGASRSGGVDPALMRLGGLIIAITLAIPLVLGFTSGSDDEALRTATPPPASIVVADERLPLEPLDDTASRASEATEATSGQVAAPASTSADTSSGDASGSGDVSSSPASAATPPASASAVPATAVPATTVPATTAAPTTTVAACGSDYEIAAGDYWIRIADAAGVSLSALLAVNGASTDTNLVPGRSICLPPGASRPAPPPAPAAASTAPAATTPPTTAPRPTTTAPRPTTTTPRPTTTTAPRPTTTTAPRPPASPSDVVAIIRSVWPDELEERAITIAWRESNHRPEVDNGFCCYGLFQIYYSVHKGWLAEMGIMSADDLRDPLANAQAAYRLYQRAGGWGPWSQTNY